MNYILFFIIFLAIISILFLKKHDLGLTILLLIMVFLLVKNPTISVSSAKTGITLFLFTALPALFPFFLVNDMLIALRVPDNIGRLFAPITRLMFNTSGYGAYVFIMSIFSGYPTGAKITSNLVQNKDITVEEGQKILSFSSTSGPMFIIGVVGTTMLKSTYAGYMLFMIHIVSSLLNGLLFSNLFSSRKSVGKLSQSVLPKKTSSTSELITDAITNSLISSGIIGGYIILFAVMLPLLDSMNFFNIISLLMNKLILLPSELSNNFIALLRASFEITNGSDIITNLSVGMGSKLILLSFILSFSGFSIIGQATNLIGKAGLNSKIYIITKLSHGLIAALLCYLLLHFNLLNTAAPVLKSSNEILTPLNTINLLEINLVLILFFNLLYKKLLKFKFTKCYKKLLRYHK